MSEYWVSKKKYFCRYCDIFIADDAPSRSHHENGMRHKGNKERFVRGLYKAGEKMKKDADEEKREMKNIEAAAQRAYALDVGAGRGGIGGSSTPAPKPAAPPPKKSSNPYTNYSTAASLGYTDPDAERINAENERRRTQGVAGEWELVPVASTSSAPAEDPVPVPTDDADVKPIAEEAVSAGVKRGAEAPAVDEEDGRGWKLQKKTARLGDIYDPGEIPIILKAKKEEPPRAESTPTVATASTSAQIQSTSSSTSTELPKWTKTQWKRATDPVDTQVNFNASSIAEAVPSEIPPPTDALPKEELAEPTLEDSAFTINKTESAAVKTEDVPSEIPASFGASLFKKRKARGGSAGGGQRDKF